MKKQRINEEMARLDGYTNVRKAILDVFEFYGDRDHGRSSIPDYPTDLNAVQRVRLIIKQDYASDIWDMVIYYLMRMEDCAMDDEIGDSDVFILACMDADQWCEAILRAAGKWEEED